jgi:hypothetical protein
MTNYLDPYLQVSPGAASVAARGLGLLLILDLVEGEL